MSFADVLVMRLLQSALSQGYRVVQDIATRDVCLLSATDNGKPFADVETARAWLRGHIGCGMFARRCKVLTGGCHH